MSRPNHPLLAAVEALGLPPLTRSSQGRPLFAGNLGRGPGEGGRGADEGAALLVVAGVHGDEPSTVEAALALHAELASSPPPFPVWLVPLLNPDGMAAGRKNSARDVDLNRNFPARSFTPAHRPGYFPGERPLCEPETAALAALVDREGIGRVVAVHAPLACVNFDGPAVGWAQTVSAACGWPARGDIGYPTPGSLGSWLGVDRGIPVLTLELPPGPYADFSDAAGAALRAIIR